MTAFPTTSNGRAASIEALSDALVLIGDRRSAAAFLADLCTPAEINAMAERWHVAQLLDSGALTYREIHDATGVSTTTIVRVARSLKQQDHGGYRKLLDRAKARP